MENDLRVQIRIAQSQIEEERMKIKHHDFMEREFFEAMKRRNSSFVLTENQVANMYEGWKMAKKYYKIT